jgi:hypothetical protein
MNGGRCSRTADAGRSWRPYCKQHSGSQRYPFITDEQQDQLDADYPAWLEREFERITVLDLLGHREVDEET